MRGREGDTNPEKVAFPWTKVIPGKGGDEDK